MNKEYNSLEQAQAFSLGISVEEMRETRKRIASRPMDIAFSHILKVMQLNYSVHEFCDNQIEFIDASKKEVIPRDENGKVIKGFEDIAKMFDDIITYIEDIKRVKS